MRTTTRTVVATAGSLLVGCVPPTAARAAETIDITQVELGNVFTAPRTPEVDVTTSSGKVKWCAFDFWGTEDERAVVDVSGGSARLPLRVSGPGYYRLHVTTEHGDCAKPAAWTTFALLPRADRSAAEPFTYSVQTHFGQGAHQGWDPRLVRLIQSAGAESVRDSQPWERVENPKGEYHFPAYLETYMRELHKHGIDPMLGFGPTNPHHDPAPAPHKGGCTPHTEAGRKAYAAYAGEVIRHYTRDLGIPVNQVGVYNEPNLRNFGDAGPGDDGEGGSPVCPADAEPAPHRDLAREVFRTLGTGWPGVTVAAPELSAGAHKFDDESFPWLRDYLSGPDGTFDGLRNLDVLSLHPYRPGGRTPEGLARDQLDKVRGYLDEHGGADIPIWITELGWRTDQISPGEQAAFVPRAHVLAMRAGVPRMNWYNFMDHHSGPFGLIHDAKFPAGGYVPKPSYVAYAVLTAQLSGLSYVSGSVSGGVHTHLFRGERAPTRVIWSTSGSRTITLGTSEPVHVTDVMGRTTTLEPSDGTVSLRISGNAKYVRGNVTLR